MVFTIWTHIVDIVPSLGNLKWSPMAGFFNSTQFKKNEKEITVPLIIPRSVLLVPPRSSFTLSLINSRSSLPVLITPHSSFRALPVLITPRFSFRAIPCSALRAFRSTFNSPHSAFPRSLSPRALIIPRSSFSVQRSPAPHTLITPRSPLLVHRSERSSFPRFPS